MKQEDINEELQRELRDNFKEINVEDGSNGEKVYFTPHANSVTYVGDFAPYISSEPQVINSEEQIPDSDKYDSINKEMQNKQERSFYDRPFSLSTSQKKVRKPNLSESPYGFEKLQPKPSSLTVKDSLNKTQQIYKVRVFRDFEFPSFSINKHNKMEDIIAQARGEFLDNFRDRDYLSFEVLNMLPFSLREPLTEKEVLVDFDFILKEIAVKNTEEKYGSIEYEKNPSNFEVVEKSTTSVTLYLRVEIEHFFKNEYQKYLDIFKFKKYYK